MLRRLIQSLVDFLFEAVDRFVGLEALAEFPWLRFQISHQIGDEDVVFDPQGNFIHYVEAVERFPARLTAPYFVQLSQVLDRSLRPSVEGAFRLGRRGLLT